VSVHQREQHPRARRLTNRSCDPRHRYFIRLLDIHVSMINES